MAKKKKQSPPAPQPITAPEPVPQVDQAQVTQGIGQTVGNLSNTVGQQNLQGTQLGMSTTANYLATDGRSLTIDPTVAAGAQKTISTSTTKLTKAEGTLKKQQTTLQTLEDQFAAAAPGTPRYKTLERQINALKPKVEKTQIAVQGLQTKIADANTTLQSGPSVTELYKKADPQTYAAIDRAGAFASQIGQITPQGQAYLDANSAGYQSRDIGQNNISAAQIGQIADVSSRDIQAARLSQIADIRAQQAAAAQARAQQTGVSSLGGQLQQTAAERLALGGRLSEGATRDAIQAARAGMAARGMATGNSALAAELLNRDRYSQARFLENAGFATGVEGQDLSRRLANTSEANQISAANMAEANRIAMANQQADLAAQQANQSTAFNLEQSNASLAQQAALANQEAARLAATQNQNTALALGQSNASLAQQASLANQDNTFRTSTFNENNRLVGAQQNLNQLGAASNYVDATNKAGFAANVDAANVSATYNPLFRNLGLTQQNIFGTNNLGSLTLGPAAQIGLTTAQINNNNNQFNNTMQGNVDSFNANQTASTYNTYNTNQTALKAAEITSGAANNAGWMSLLGGAAQGAGALGGGYLAGQSDRREKTDIKKVGKDPLGLNTYSYRYKGDDRTRTGPMAQEVRKALPEAVEEVEINGKKRLAIRPKVLGQAYADAIAAEQKIMFPDGYVVGSGKA